MPNVPTTPDTSPMDSTELAELAEAVAAIAARLEADDSQPGARAKATTEVAELLTGKATMVLSLTRLLADQVGSLRLLDGALGQLHTDMRATLKAQGEGVPADVARLAGPIGRTLGVDRVPTRLAGVEALVDGFTADEREAALELLWKPSSRRRPWGAFVPTEATARAPAT